MRFALAFVLGLAGSAFGAQLSSSKASATYGPAFFIANGGVVKGSGKHRVDYEAVSMPNVAKEAVSLATGVVDPNAPYILAPVPGARRPVLVYLGAAIRSEALSRLGSDAGFLRSAMQDPALEVGAFPYVSFARGESPVEALRAAAGNNLATIGCDNDATDVSADLLRQIMRDGQVTVVCGGAAAGAAEEAARVEAAFGAARDAAGPSVALLYISRPVDMSDKRSGSAVLRRGLAEGDDEQPQTGADWGVAKNGAWSARYPCVASAGDQGAKCFYQVQVLEGAIFFLILITAVLSGVSCLGMLKAPTRFETPKSDKQE